MKRNNKKAKKPQINDEQGINKSNFDYDKYDEYDLTKPAKNKKQNTKPHSTIPENQEKKQTEPITVEELTLENDVKLKHVIIATEKLIQMVQNMSANIDTINIRLNKLEHNYGELVKNNEYKNYSFEADDALKDWMMEEKSKDSFDYPMSKNEIQKAFVDYNRRAGK